MPVYNFECDKCKKNIKVLQSFKDSNPICSSCDGQIKMNRLVSAIGRPKFHGSGFYETDYKQNLKKPLESTDGSKDKKND